MISGQLEKYFKMETQSIDRLKLLHPTLKNDALDAYADAIQKTPVGIHPYVVQTLRTFDESNYLYSLGRTKVNPDGKSSSNPMGNIVTNARAGQSYHNYGLALDFCIFDDGKQKWVVDNNWMIVVECFKRKGFAWGGDFSSFKDNPHLEKRFNYNWRSLLQMYNNKDFILGTTYLNIIV